MRTKTHLIFDMDGTLIDSSTLLANTINYVREKIHLPRLSDEKIVEAINDASINPARFFYESEKFEKIHEFHFHNYYKKNHSKECRLYPGVKRFLKDSSKTRKLSIATNAYDVSATPLLESLGILGYFDIVVCGNEVDTPKPDPSMIEKIIERYGEKKESFVMIGDGVRDIKAANKANISSLLVSWGFTYHPKGAICDIDELREILGIC